MTTGSIEQLPAYESLEERVEKPSDAPASSNMLIPILKRLASLKLTVTLFAMSIFIVLAGTLAQRYQGIWQVINTYFRQTDNYGFVWIDLAIFFPADWDITGSFPFPGGWLIGVALFANLLAAHAVRFRIQAHGKRLWAGLAVIALGIAGTAGVVASGMNNQPETQLSDEFASLVWNAVRAGMVIVTVALGYMLYIVERDRRGTAYWILFGLVNLLGIFDLLLYAMPDWRLDKPGLRIMWQLMKAVGAGTILLVGCALVFRRRAGIVLLHAGVGLMMVGELWTGITAQEAQMPIFEGYPGYYVEDVRVPELAVIDHSDPKQDKEIVIPRQILIEHVAQDAGPIEHDELPFDIRVVDYFDNVDFFSLPPSMDPDDPRAPSTLQEFTGLGMTNWVKKRAVVSGAEASDRSDIPSAHVEVLDKNSGQSLGKYLVSTGFTLNPMDDRQYVRVGDKYYELTLRFARQYVPMQLDYKEFRFDKYVGTQQAKNYSARLQLVDAEKGVESEVHIWMNNPLRYDGRTYYQSGVRPDPRWPNGEKQATVLQVVENESWMIPYTACGIVLVAMLAHFPLSLVSFLMRRQQSLGSISSEEGAWSWVVPTALVVLGGVYVASKARPVDASPGELQVHTLGQLPVAYQGRVKPMDTVARNALRVISDREFFEVEIPNPTGKKPDKQKLPAIVWFLDLVSSSPNAGDHRVIRIDNLEVLGMLGLEPRQRYRYSIREIFGEPPHTKYNEFQKNVIEADAKSNEQRTFLDRQVLKVATRLQLLLDMRESFMVPQFLQANLSPADLRNEFIRWQQEMDRFRSKAVFPVPPDKSGSEWQILPVAHLFNQVATEKNVFAENWFNVLEAYRTRDVNAFNRDVKLLEREFGKRQELLQAGATDPKQPDGKRAAADGEPGGVAHAEQLNLKRASFESWFNRFDPFALSRVYYVAAFILSILAWLGWSRTFNRAALWLILLTFAVHTFGLAARVYISGRPPVTNLYSSAVFIGWGCVLLGVVFEGVYRIGFGNIMASIAGFTTLLISHQLAADGDTMRVLQAVLDTNFWLATHVVCITLGYSTTLVAGLFGLIYLLAGVFLNALDEMQRKALTRMTYGTLCFAIFFSFIGTVLGGLWADDSWGRFWGWDPKENGALMIVIWNALVLHARWGGMAGPRGMAVLAVFGNVVTAWSWFGVNELGVGLHSYGFTSGVKLWLGVFVLSQLVFIGLGSLPQRIWRSD